MNKAKLENWCQSYLADQQLHQLLEKVDADLAEKVRQSGCQHCCGKLHRAKYRRKPRGQPRTDREEREEQQAVEQPEDVFRDSFCCDQEGCRKRHTPPSVRFLGRKVYWGFVVVLVSVMRHGLKPERLQALRETLGVDRRTVERWREWWLGIFVESSFWRGARARFMPPLCPQTMPWSLGIRFEIQRRDRLLALLKFLAPITTPTAWKEFVM